MYFVYVLENQLNGSFYIGYTANIRQRISDHQNGKGARVTKLKKCWKCIYFEAYTNQKAAIGREKFLKGGSGRKYLYKQNPPAQEKEVMIDLIVKSKYLLGYFQQTVPKELKKRDAVVIKCYKNKIRRLEKELKSKK